MQELLPAIPNDFKETHEVASWATSEIQNDMDAQIATERLQAIAQKKKMMDKFRDEFIRPQKRILADFEARCRAALEPFVSVENILRNKLGAYMDSMRQKRHEELEALRLVQLEEAKKKKDELDAKILLEGNLNIPVELQETRIKTLENMDVTETRQTIRTSAGRVAESLYWVWEVEDLALVPQMLFVLDEKALNEKAKKYSKEPCEIPGIRFIQKARVVVQ